ncbi:MAG: alpha/beta fold hydrolase [Chitinophagaceae bacterium]
MKLKYILSFFTLVIICFGAKAQINKNIIGIWKGKLNVGIEIRLVFHIKDSSGILFSSADSPDQNAYGLKCDTTYFSGNQLTIKMVQLGATYTGTLQNDTVLNGMFTQRGVPLALTLKRVEKISQRKRPQTPHPPYAYKSEDVVYENADKSLKYGATITIPNGSGTFPAAILITGSGAQNRDEEIMEHKIFSVIADHLTKNGFIVLRVDDRGVGKSTGIFGDATTADFANDVSAGVDYLLFRNETDKKRIGLIGHSEGGMIAPMVAVKRKDINFIILLAGPGVKTLDLLVEQTAAIIISSGVGEKAVNAYKPVYKKLLVKTLNEKDTAKALQKAIQITEKWAGKTDTVLLSQLGMADKTTREKASEQLVKSVSGKWFKYFLQFDPKPYLQKLSCKMLALNGSKDLQVIASQNIPGIEAALKKSKATVKDIKVLEGLNHLFQSCKKCTITEYGELEETFSPIALQEISEWLKKNIK